MAKGRINKYISIEASEDESEITSEDIDDLPKIEEIDVQRPKHTFNIENIAEEEYFDEEEEDVSCTEDLMQSQLIPRASSPRLFIVRVKRGSERDIALRIVHNKPNICSIVCKDGLKGYIYVEAFHKQQVLDALGRLRGINRTKISIVPQNEMIEAMIYRHDYKHVEFGRVKKGKYKGDLVQVLSSDGDMLRIRLVPRINGIKKLFNPDDFRDEIIKRGKGCYIYNRDMYINGFLEKDVLYGSIDFDVEPNFEELEQFDAKKKLEIGDKVEVFKGELLGTKGTIYSIRGSFADLRSENETYEVNLQFLKKYFNFGEEVSYGDQNGIVTKVDGDTYYVALNNFTEEVKSSIDNIKPPRPFVKILKKRDRVKQIFKRDFLVNKTVQIKKGKFKGYVGIVKDVYMNKCRVQIESNLECVTLLRDDVVEIKKDSINNNIPINYGISAGNKKDCVSSAISDRYSVMDFSETQSTVNDLDSYHNLNVAESTGNSVNNFSKFKGALIIVNGSQQTLQDIRNGMLVTNSGVFDRKEVKLVPPSKNDNVCVIYGESNGSSGVVLDIKNDSCVIKMDDGPIKNIPLSYVSKKPY